MIFFYSSFTVLQCILHSKYLALSQRMVTVKFLLVISRIEWLNGEHITVSRTISVLILRVATWLVRIKVILMLTVGQSVSQSVNQPVSQSVSQLCEQ